MIRELLLGLATLIPASSTAAEPVRITYPTAQTILYGEIKVRGTPADADIDAYLKTPHGWQRLPEENGVPVFHAGTSMSSQCLKIIARDEKGEILGKDEVCTRPFTKSAAEARPPPHIRIHAIGNSFKTVPEGCTLLRHDTLVCEDSFATDIMTLEERVQGECSVINLRERRTLAAPPRVSREGTRVVCHHEDLLRPENIRCEFGGQACTVTAVDRKNESGTLYLHFMLDASPSMSRLKERVHAAAENIFSFVTRTPYEVKIRLGTFSDDYLIMETSEQSRDGALGYTDDPRVIESFLALVPQNGKNTNLFAAVNAELSSASRIIMADSVTGRKALRALVLITDCADTSYDKDAEKEALSHARNDGIPIFIVRPRGARPSTGSCLSLASESGGKVFEGGAELTSQLERLATTLMEEYEVFFRTTERTDGERSIALSAPGVEILHAPSWRPPEDPVRLARRVKYDAPLEEYLPSADIIARRGSVADAEALYRKFRHYLRKETKLSASSLAEYERALPLTPEYQYRRSATFAALIDPLRRGLLHGDAREQLRAAKLLVNVEDFLGEYARNYAQYFQPYLATFMKQDFPAPAPAKELLQEHGDLKNYSGLPSAWRSSSSR